MKKREGYKDLSKALKEYKGEKIMWYHYANEADMINKIVTGHTAKKLRELINISSSEMVRDHLTVTQISAIRYLQRTNSTLIDEGFSFDERKEKLTERFNKRFLLKIKQEFDEKLLKING